MVCPCHVKGSGLGSAGVASGEGRDQSCSVEHQAFVGDTYTKIPEEIGIHGMWWNCTQHVVLDIELNIDCK